MRLNAYYYSFGGTGEECVDRVLSAVACAGKAYHHTEHWADECSAWDGLRGDSPVDWIANAAEDAAAEVAKLRAEVSRLTAERAAIWREGFHAAEEAIGLNHCGVDLCPYADSLHSQVHAPGNDPSPR